MSVVDDRICRVDTVLDRIQIFNESPNENQVTTAATDDNASVDATDVPVEDRDTTPQSTDSTRILKLKAVCDGSSK